MDSLTDLVYSINFQSDLSELASIEQATQDIDRNMNATDTETRNINNNIKELSNGLEITNNELNQTHSNTMNTDSAMRNVSHNIREINNNLNTTNNDLQETHSNTNNTDNSMKSVSNHVRKTNSNLKETNTNAKNTDNSIRNIAKSTESVNKSTRNTERNIRNINSKTQKTDRSFRSIGRYIKDVYNNIRNASKQTQKLDNNAKKAESTFKKLAKAIAGALITKKIIDVGKAGLSGAADLEQYRSTLNVVMKDQKKAAETFAWAVDFANRTPFTTDQLVDATVKLQSYGLTAKDVMTDIGDMSGVMGKSLDQGVEAIADAQTGELERLKEFGITKQMIVEHGNKIMRGKQLVNNKGQITDQKNFNKTLFSLMRERYKGGMDLQSKSFKGVMSTIRGVISTSLAKMMGIDDKGNVKSGSMFHIIELKALKLSNTLQILAKNGTLDRWGNNISKTFLKVGRAFNFISKHRKIIVPAIMAIVGSFAAFKTINKVIGIINKFKNALSRIRLVTTLLTGPVGLVVIGIAALVASLIYAYNHSEKFRQQVQKLWSSLKEVADFIMTYIVPVIVGAFSSLFDSAKAIFGNIIEVVGGLITALSGIIDFIVGVFTGDWSRAWTGIKEIFSGIWESIKGVFKGVINFITSGINMLIRGVNKIHFKVPDWAPIPGLKGKEFGINIPEIPRLAKGTDNWNGGIVQVHEKGGEIIDLPGGSRVFPHDQSVSMAREQGKKEGKPQTPASISLTININDSNDPKQVAREVKKQIESIFSTVNLQLGYGSI